MIKFVSGTTVDFQNKVIGNINQLKLQDTGGDHSYVIYGNADLVDDINCKLPNMDEGSDFFVFNNATAVLTNKSFSDDLGVGTASPTARLHVKGATDSNFLFVPKTSEGMRFNGTSLDALSGTSLSGALTFNYYTDADAVVLYSGGATKRYFYPGTDDLHDFGYASKRWDNIYATNAVIQTSDRRMKEQIKETDLGLDFINKLKPVSYKFKKKNRVHYGLIAQDVEDTLRSVGKSVDDNHKTNDFAGYCYSDGREPTIREVEKMKEDYPELEDEEVMKKFQFMKESKYALRYCEFISPLIKAVQELSRKVELLGKKLGKK